ATAFVSCTCRRTRPTTIRSNLGGPCRSSSSASTPRGTRSPSDASPGAPATASPSATVATGSRMLAIRNQLRRSLGGNLEKLAKVGGGRLGADVEAAAPGDLEGGAGGVEGPVVALVRLHGEGAADDGH